MTTRLATDEAAYQAAKAAKTLIPLHLEEPIADFQYWKIIENRFPHSRIADENHLLVLKRECSIDDIQSVEWVEFLSILQQIGQRYDTVAYNLPGVRSIKNIVHCHLYRLKPEYK